MPISFPPSSAKEWADDLLVHDLSAGVYQAQLQIGVTTSANPQGLWREKK